jgi:hypothetical protein
MTDTPPGDKCGDAFGPELNDSVKFAVQVAFLKCGEW